MIIVRIQFQTGRSKDLSSMYVFHSTAPQESKKETERFVNKLIFLEIIRLNIGKTENTQSYDLNLKI